MSRVASWAVVPLPGGDELPVGLVVIGPTHRSPKRAERRAAELEEMGAGRWPVDFVVCALDEQGVIVEARLPNPRRWPEPAKRWAKSSLERLGDVDRAEGIGAILSESELSHAELSRLQREAVGPDPEKSAAAKAAAAARRDIRAALSEAGGSALPEPLARAAERAAFVLVRDDDRRPFIAVAGVLRDAARLEAQATELAQIDARQASEVLTEEAENAEDDATRILLLGAAEFAAVAPGIVPCVSPPGEPGTIEGTGQRRASIIWGAETQIFVPSQRGGLDTYPAQYALLAIGDMGISHDPVSFRASPIFPPELQERDYARDQAEQVKVTRAESRFEGPLVISTVADASSGPPIVDQGPPWVLGGNSRSMVIARILASGRGNAYTAALRAALTDCSSYGLAGDQVEDDSALVRVLRGRYDPVTISRALNLGFTMVAGAAARAVSTGTLLPARLFELLGEEMLDESATLSSAFVRRGGEIIALLRDADIITPQTATVWQATRDGRLLPELSREGRQLLKDALMGRLLSDREALTLSTPRLEDLYERAAPALLALAEAAS